MTAVASAFLSNKNVESTICTSAFGGEVSNFFINRGLINFNREVRMYWQFEMWSRVIDWWNDYSSVLTNSRRDNKTTKAYWKNNELYKPQIYTEDRAFLSACFFGLVKTFNYRNLANV